ncbi:50S ribosomal protein L2 [Buchnera aphidicola (Chaitoregma tattakana)]|uniref:50S ribosomal protein L2 n=1 Tax=Buchnera aphidicola TaxID=9 RepID=UPI0031B89A7B
MILKKVRPTSPGRRHLIKVDSSNLCKKRPIKRLLFKNVKTGGRNNSGRITTRHIGGGHKKKYRKIDFKRRKDNILAIVKRIEYDPNRSSNIALILYKDGTKSYILEPKNIKVGDTVISGDNVEIRIGNCLSIKNIPTGEYIHNIELRPGKGAQISRSAGNHAQIISKEKKYVSIRLRSGELRKIYSRCRATIGEVGNTIHMLKKLGKAGAKRWAGVRPTVRGTAMNPVDHPHGGGEGRNFGKHPVSPWGKQTKGKKTRKNKRTQKFIIHNKN